ncbi:MAG TPA: hypothetical protein VFV08_00335 [Puia sp.]|nr:hypothetical protein [Puia sp.]
MKIKYLLAFFLFTTVACNKNGNGDLTLKIKSVSTNDVAVGQPMEIIFDFTEKSSVIDTLWLLKIRINQHVTTTIRDTIPYTIPSYPKNSKGQLQLDLDYQNDIISAVSPPQIDSTHSESDSLIMKFVAKDLDNNTSDTAVTGLIVVQRTP